MVLAQAFAQAAARREYRKLLMRVNAKWFNGGCHCWPGTLWVQQWKDQLSCRLRPDWMRPCNEGARKQQAQHC
jgi:hypothetical protein